SGANEHGITGRYLQSGLFQPRLDILDVDCSAGLEILDAFELRDVDEDATGEDSILEIVNGIFCVTIGLLHLFRIRLVDVAKHAVVVDMCEGVEMSVRDSVERDADPISSQSEHLMLIRLWIVDRLFGVRITGERYREAFLYQG